MKRKLFCEISPFCYRISVEKEIFLRRVRDFFSNEKIAKTKDPSHELPNMVKSHASVLVRRLVGVDMRLQENKVKNIELACAKINGIIIKPGETFSFWRTVGRTKKKYGYKKGLSITRKGFSEQYGGGLCQMANMVHWLVLNSPLAVTELYHHSDALFPDDRRRVPFGTGTSVTYNNLDYRFRNDTDQSVQLLVRIEGGDLCGELLSERPFPFRYRLIEEDHHYSLEGEKYYRISNVIRLVTDRASGELIRRETVLRNHSEVMYDYSLIPADEIRESGVPV